MKALLTIISRRILFFWCFAGIATGLAPTPVLANPEPLPEAHAAVLDQVVGAADTVVFGEDSHGMQAVHEVVPRIFRHLVEEKGFRVFVFEVQWETTTGLSDFLSSDRTELNTMDSYWLNGAFASQPIADMLVWVREWNRAHPDDTVQIAGYQPENPVADMRALIPYLGEVAGSDAEQLIAGVAECRAQDESYKTDLDFVIAQGQRTHEGKPNYTPEERASCLDGLYAIRNYLKRNEERISGSVRPAAQILADVKLTSLIAYVGVIRRALDAGAFIADADPTIQSMVQGIVYGQGDEARFEIYKQLRKLRFPNAKIFHWMHNWHAFQNASQTGELPGKVGIPRTTVSLGERIASEPGRDVRTILTIVPCDKSCAEPDASLETEIRDRLGNDATWVNFADPGKLKDVVGKSGQLFANHHQFGFDGVVLKDQADGLLYLPKSKIVGR